MTIHAMCAGAGKETCESVWEKKDTLSFSCVCFNRSLVPVAMVQLSHIIGGQQRAAISNVSSGGRLEAELEI